MVMGISSSMCSSGVIVIIAIIVIVYRCYYKAVCVAIISHQWVYNKLLPAVIFNY